MKRQSSSFITKIKRERSSDKNDMIKKLQQRNHKKIISCKNLIQTLSKPEQFFYTNVKEVKMPDDRDWSIEKPFFSSKQTEFFYGEEKNNRRKNKIYKERNKRFGRLQRTKIVRVYLQEAGYIIEDEEIHKDFQPIDEIYVDNNRIAAMGGCVLN